MSKQKRGTLIPILGGIIILALVAASYLYWLNKNQTALPTNLSFPSPEITQSKIPNWQTYSNPEFSFSIDYPNDYKIRALEDEQTPPNQFYFTIVSDYENNCLEDPKSNCNQPGPDIGIISASIYKNISATSLNEWLKSHFPKLNDSPQEVLVNIKPVETLNMKNGLSFHYTVESVNGKRVIAEGTYGWAFYDKEKQTIVVFSRSLPLTTDPLTADVLSTFKFTN